MSQRRAFLFTLAGGAGALGLWRWRAGPLPQRELPSTVRIAEFDASGRALGVIPLPTIRKSDAEWKRQLALDQYMMTRRADTELAFAGEFWNFHGDGLYRCVCCGTALFDSQTKFNSGTGWPSFSAPIAPENITELHDSSWGMSRTEVRCRRCDAHLGHIFDDGPPPTGLRYCINSVSLRFVARAIPRNLDQG
jgi:peptide-methionine (R)-S-oxide reductase